MDNNEKDKIKKTLEERWALNPCPRCMKNDFILWEWYFNQSIQDNLNGIILWWPTIPSIWVICSNCWYISQHALGVLNLLPKNTENGK